MRREGRVAGKATNHSRLTGKCKVVGCTTCHESLPLNKSRAKGKGRIKRLLSDIPSTHLLSDWRVSKVAPPCGRSRKVVRPCLKWDADTDWNEEDSRGEGYGSDDGGKEPEGWALSISLLLDTALEHIQESVAAKIEKQNAEFTVNTHDDTHNDAPGHGNTDDDDENTTDDVEAPVVDFESFRHEFEVFKSEIEAGCDNHTPSVAESADSWSGVELSDAEDGEWEDDDWSIVYAIPV